MAMTLPCVIAGSLSSSCAMVRSFLRSSYRLGRCSSNSSMVVMPSLANWLARSEPTPKRVVMDRVSMDSEALGVAAGIRAHDSNGQELFNDKPDLKEPPN